jgi:GcrA cell cycle regulator
VLNSKQKVACSRTCSSLSSIRLHPNDFDWSQAAVNLLRDLHAQGLPFRVIGEAVGCGEQAAIGKAHRLRLPARQTQPPRAAAQPPRGGASELAEALRVARRAERPAFRAPAPIAQRPLLVPVIGRDACCWPLGDPGTRSFRFCGEPAIFARPYCPGHHCVAYVRVRDRREDDAA